MAKQKVPHSNIVRLGLVSFFNDLSSEAVIRLLPLYLLQVVRSSFTGIGVIEAIAESLSVVIKPFSGSFSDRFRRRKPLTVAGYALSTLSRPFFVIMHTATGVLFIRVLDRIGKGLRTAPRDALISEYSSKDSYGRDFALTRAMDAAGAVLGLGAVAAYFLNTPLAAENGVPRLIGMFSALGIISFIVLVFTVSDSRPPQHHLAPAKKQPRFLDVFQFHSTKKLNKYLLAVFAFALASSSDAFLILRGHELRISTGHLFLILAGFSVVSMLSATPLGSLSDRIGRKAVLASGWAIYATCYFLLSFAVSGLWSFVAVLLFYGLFYGFTEGVEKAVISDLAPTASQGTAFGVLGLVKGLGLLIANITFGALYDYAGFKLAFLSSAVLGAFAVLFLLLTPFEAPDQKRSS